VIPTADLLGHVDIGAAAARTTPTVGLVENNEVEQAVAVEVVGAQNPEVELLFGKPLAGGEQFVAEKCFERGNLALWPVELPGNALLNHNGRCDTHHEHHGGECVRKLRRR
jgi:hypothetical protein